MSLYGWKQLILWSLEHSCLDEKAFAEVLSHWEQQWDDFVRRVIEKYGDDVPDGSESRGTNSAE